MIKTYFFRTLVAILLVSSPFTIAQRSCYYPDGSLAQTDVPCTSDADTVCCGPGFACLGNGVCQFTPLALQLQPDLNPKIGYFRGSCTDQTWSSTSCPQFCLGSEYAMNGGNSMGFCNDNTFCCFGGLCNCTTNFNTTVFEADPIAFTTVGFVGSPASSSISTIHSSISTSTTLPTSSATTTSLLASLTASTINSTAPTLSAPLSISSPTNPILPTAKQDLSTSAKVGIGLGIPLGLFALLLITWLFCRNRRQKGEISRLKAQHSLKQPAATSPTFKELNGETELWSYQAPKSSPLEHPTQTTDPVELYQSPREML